MQAKWNGLGLSKLWLVILARCYLFLTKIRKIHAHIFRAIWWVFLTTHHLLFILNASLKFRANDSSLPKIKRPFNDKIVCNYISELWFLVFYTSAFGFDPARAHGGKFNRRLDAPPPGPWGGGGGEFNRTLDYYFHMAPH